jgi:serine/threonine protein kinase
MTISHDSTKASFVELIRQKNSDFSVDITCVSTKQDKKHIQLRCEDMTFHKFGETLLLAIPKLEKAQCLGVGGFGTVYEAYPVKNTGEIDKESPIAIKVLNKKIKKDLSLKEQMQLFTPEVETANLFFSGRVVKVKLENKYEAIVLMSKLNGKALTGSKGVNPDIKKLSPVERIQLLREVLKAYKHLHASKRFQRDIKPDNILIDIKTLENGKKIFDVTLVDIGGKEIAPVVAAPELLDNSFFGDDFFSRKSTVKSEIYAMTSLFATILGANLPFRKKYAYQDSRSIRTKSLPKISNAPFDYNGIENNYSGDKYNMLIKLLDTMQAPNPKNRIGTLDKIDENLVAIENLFSDIESNEVYPEIEPLYLPEDEDQYPLIQALGIPEEVLSEFEMTEPDEDRQNENAQEQLLRNKRSLDLILSDINYQFSQDAIIVSTYDATITDMRQYLTIFHLERNIASLSSHEIQMYNKAATALAILENKKSVDIITGSREQAKLINIANSNHKPHQVNNTQSLLTRLNTFNEIIGSKTRLFTIDENDQRKNIISKVFDRLCTMLQNIFLTKEEDKSKKLRTRRLVEPLINYSVFATCYKKISGRIKSVENLAPGITVESRSV